MVYAEPSPARDALFWQTAATALRAPATVLSTRDAADIAAQLRAHGLDIDANRALHGRANLCALRPPTDASRPGIDLLMEALQALVDQCGAQGSMMLIEGAEAFFAWHDAARLAQEGQRLGEWCARHRCAVLLVMGPPTPAPGQPAPDLQGFHGRFAGAVQLSQQQGQYTWEVAFWRDNQAVVAGEIVPLRFAPHEHRLMVAAQTFTDTIEEAGMLAPDEQRVIVSRDAVLRERYIPEHWRVVDSNEAAVASAAHAVAATVLLHYGGGRELEALAEQVHRLRRGAGRALKIAVREDKEAMRQHYELLMLNLGANLVIAQRTPFARVQAMIEGLQGQVFSRPILADYRNALSAVLTTSTSGYVPPAEFVALVRDAVERSRMIRLPHVLLQLPLLPEVAHVEALRLPHEPRGRSLHSRQRQPLRLLLRLPHGRCGRRVPARVPAPAGRAVPWRRAQWRPGSIGATLGRFEAEIAEVPPPDYSSWLARQQEAPRPAPAPTSDMPDMPDMPDTTAALVAHGSVHDGANAPPVAQIPTLPLRDTPPAQPRAMPQPHPCRCFDRTDATCPSSLATSSGD